MQVMLEQGEEESCLVRLVTRGRRSRGRTVKGSPATPTRQKETNEGRNRGLSCGIEMRLMV
jgi:hypothetical protein